MPLAPQLTFVILHSTEGTPSTGGVTMYRRLITTIGVTKYTVRG